MAEFNQVMSVVVGGAGFVAGLSMAIEGIRRETLSMWLWLIGCIFSGFSILLLLAGATLLVLAAA